MSMDYCKVQNKTRNKYANKSLKTKGNHFNNYKGEQGYNEAIKTMSFNTIFKCLICFIVVVILAFYLFTK